MDLNTTAPWLALLIVALVLVTAYYAIVTHGILSSNKTMTAEMKRMADETKRMAEVSQTTYLASLAPAIDASTSVDSLNPDTITVSTTLTNLGGHAVTILGMYVECRTPEVGRRVYEERFNVQLRNHERVLLRMDVPAQNFDVVWFMVQDIAGQRHEVGAAGVKAYTPVARV